MQFLVVIAEDIPTTSSLYHSRHKEYIDVEAKSPIEAQEKALLEARNHRKFFSGDRKMIVDRCIECKRD